MSYVETKNFMTSRIVPSMIIGGISGLSAGYYIGDLAFKFAISGCIGFGLMGTQFFGGIHLLQKWRKCDDVINYVLSGSLTSLTTLKYYEISGVLPKSSFSKNVSIVLTGSISAIIYRYVEAIVYDHSKSMWIDNRIYHDYSAEKKILQKKVPRPLPRYLIGEVDLKPGMSFQPDPSSEANILTKK